MTCDATYMRELRQRRKEQGLCGQCGKETVPGRPVCDDCREKNTHRNRGYRENNRASVRDRLRKWQLWNSYGITSEDKVRMFFEQGGRCRICGKDWDDVWIPDCHVDHDHDTGTVRGLLCSDCNTGIGLFRDDARILERAIDYLELSKTLVSEKR